MFHHREPKLANMGPPDNGWEIDYDSASFNGRMLGAGDPVRVCEGQRVLFRLLNASATDEVRVALPGHRFRIVAMDGNPVPREQTVDVTYLDIGERVDAVVEMNQPGVWVFGSAKEDKRKKGLGVVVEYAGKSGDPQWRQPANLERGPWDYSQFSSGTTVPEADHTFEMKIERFQGIEKISTAGRLTGSRSRKSRSSGLKKGRAIVSSSITTAVTFIRCACIVTFSRLRRSRAGHGGTAEGRHQRRGETRRLSTSWPIIRD